VSTVALAGTKSESLYSNARYDLHRSIVPAVATCSPQGEPRFFAHRSRLSLTNFRSLLTPPGCSGVTPEGVVSYHKEWVSRVIYIVMEREGVQEAWGGVTRGGARRLVGGNGGMCREFFSSFIFFIFIILLLFAMYLLRILLEVFWTTFPSFPPPSRPGIPKTGGNVAFLTPPAAISFPLFSI